MISLIKLSGIGKKQHLVEGLIREIWQGPSWQYQKTYSIYVINIEVSKAPFRLQRT